MKAIILAAGRGARLNGRLGDDPKCLAPIGGMSLIERQLGALTKAGIRDIVVLVGFGADRVRRVCGTDVHFIENTRFEETNSLYSLWLARELLAEGFVVMNSDVLFHPQLLDDLLTCRYEDALLVAPCDERSPPLGNEEMKVRVRGGRVIDISKTIAPNEADGENVGIAKFGPSGARLLIEQMDGLIMRGGGREWAPRAFKAFAEQRILHAIGTRGFPWIEIDFPQDYHRAVDEVLPQMDEIPTR